MMRSLPCILVLVCTQANAQVDPNAVTNAQNAKSAQDFMNAASSINAPKVNPDPSNGQFGQSQIAGQSAAQAMQAAANPQARPPDLSSLSAVTSSDKSQFLSEGAKQALEGAKMAKPDFRVQVPEPPTPEVKTPDFSPPTPKPGSLEEAAIDMGERAALKAENVKNFGGSQLEYLKTKDQLHKTAENLTNEEKAARQKAQATGDRILKNLGNRKFIVRSHVLGTTNHTLELEKMSNAYDCSDFYLAGVRENGIYSIKPVSRKLPFEVYCDLEDTNGGGWTLIQRRGDYDQPYDYFYKNWTEYKRGFGPLTQEFWLGNQQIRDLTSQGQYSLRINMMDSDNNYFWAEYLLFSVGTDLEKYQLKISGFSSNLEFDSMSYQDLNMFSTYDNDNDKSLNSNCAVDRKGGWWYNNCANANLNGVKADNNENSTLTWYVEGRGHVPLSKVEMKVRPKTF